MIELKNRIFDRIFEKAEYYEAGGMLHIASPKGTTGKPCHWIAHPLCNRRLKGWIGFSDIQYAKTEVLCEECFHLHLIVLTNSSKESNGDTK